MAVQEGRTRADASRTAASDVRFLAVINQKSSKVELVKVKV
jgi:hypothetical protein